MKTRKKKPSMMKGAEPAVRKYLDTIGFVEYSSQERYENDLRSRFGRAGEELARAIELRADGKYPDAELYSLKNSSLPLSLMAGFWDRGGFYVSYLSWLVRQKFPVPSRILDIGCDNGIVTCFYAKHFPQAEVVGIDVCENGVARARELSAKLGLKNASFQVLDVRNVAEAFHGTTVQMITATHVFRDILDVDRAERVAASLAEVQQLEIKADYLEILKSIRTLTAPGGTFLTTDYLEYRALGFWTLMVSRAGWTTNWPRSSLICWQEPDVGKLTVPIVVAENQEPAVPWTINDALGFSSYPKLTGMDKEPAYTDAAAEALFQAVNPKSLVRGVKATDRSGAVKRLEIWVGGPLAFLYEYPNWNDRNRLFVCSKNSLPYLLLEMNAIPANLPSGCRSEFYGGEGTVT